MNNALTIKFKTRAVSMLLCVCLLLTAVWIFAPKSSAAASTVNSGGSRIIVSLGDSYSAGEGIEPFYGQNDEASEKIKNQDWLAHRSEESWPGKLKLPGVSGTMADHRGENWYFVATSGAVTDNLKSSQLKEYNISGYSGQKYIDPQLNVFKQLGDKKAEYVTITMGGNDAQFSDVVTTAAVPNPFNPGELSDKLDAIWNEFYNGVDGGKSIRDRIREAYYDIQAAAGADAKIIVAGYPKLLEQSGKGALFSKEEADLINQSVTRFNDEIAAIVKACKADGMKICFVSVEEEFDGHEAYSKDPYLNGVIINVLDSNEDLNEGVGPSAYSMHPNEKGAEAYAKCVQAKIDEIEKDGGKSEWPTMTSSDEREIALVLDVSGSMSGTPIAETKKAADEFVSTVLKEDAGIGIVAYDDDALRLSNFCMNESYLKNTLQNLNAGGGTNIEAGLAEAYSMLENSTAKKKIIVLMSDGEPNEGKVGDELIAYADSIKDEGVYIYTLGFFEKLGSGKSSAQELMEKIASDGCHYEVSDAESLVFFFGDIADQINGQKYIYIRIACPVDVTVTYKGETLCSVEDDINTRTDFGTLTFEDNDGDEDDDDSKKDNRIKVLRLKEGPDYDIQIEGNGRGYMDYTIGFMNSSGEYSDLRKFTNIKITKQTVIDTVATASKTTVLYVDEDGDGEYDLKYSAAKNQYGELVEDTYTVYIVIGVVALVIIAAVVIVVLVKKRSRSKFRT